MTEWWRFRAGENAFKTTLTGEELSQDILHVYAGFGRNLPPLCTIDLSTSRSSFFIHIFTEYQCIIHASSHSPLHTQENIRVDIGMEGADFYIEHPKRN